MKKLILIVMLSLCTVTITSRPVQTYAYTEEQKQQAKSWLSAHGYPPTRAGAEQAYQDYMERLMCQRLMHILEEISRRK